MEYNSVQAPARSSLPLRWNKDRNIRPAMDRIYAYDDTWKSFLRMTRYGNVCHPLVRYILRLILLDEIVLQQ